MRTIVKTLAIVATVLAPMICRAESRTSNACDFPYLWEGEGVYRFALENDLFTKSDRYYTNGFKASWVSPGIDKSLNTPNCSRAIPTWFASGLSDLAGYSYKSRTLKEHNITVSWGQDIFTPADRKPVTLITDDRPYSAWMYLGFGMNGRENINEQNDANPHSTLHHWHILHSLEIDIGVVGPAALGEQFQNGVHRARGLATWDGWRNQLRNEPGIKLTYERKYRPDFVRQTLCASRCDLIGHLGATIGNVATHANAGLEARVGLTSLPDDFGTSPIRPGANGDAPLPTNTTRKNMSALAYVALNGRWIARDISLDGNTWKDSHRVNKRNNVADIVTGVEFRWRQMTISFFRAARSKEFEGQTDKQRYGGILFSVDSR